PCGRWWSGTSWPLSRACSRPPAALAGPRRSRLVPCGWSLLVLLGFERGKGVLDAARHVLLAGETAVGEFLDLGVVLVLGHHVDLEQHEGMVGAAELGALAVVGAELVRRDVEAVLVARDDVELE